MDQNFDMDFEKALLNGAIATIPMEDVETFSQYVPGPASPSYDPSAFCPPVIPVGNSMVPPITTITPGEVREPVQHGRRAGLVEFVSKSRHQGLTLERTPKEAAMKHYEDEEKKKRVAFAPGGDDSGGRSFLDQLIEEHDKKKKEKVHKYASNQEVFINPSYQVFNYGEAMINYFDGVKQKKFTLPTLDDYISICEGTYNIQGFPIDLNAPCEVQILNQPKPFFETNRPTLKDFHNNVWKKASGRVLVVGARNADFYRPLTANKQLHTICSDEEFPPMEKRYSDREFRKGIPDEKYDSIIVPPHFFDKISTKQQLHHKLADIFKRTKPGSCMYFSKPIMNDFEPRSSHLLLSRHSFGTGYGLQNFVSPSGNVYTQYDVSLGDLIELARELDITAVPHYVRASNLSDVSGSDYSIQVLRIQFLHKPRVYCQPFHDPRFLPLMDVNPRYHRILKEFTSCHKDKIGYLDYVDLPKMGNRSLMWAANPIGAPVFGLVHDREVYLKTEKNIYVFNQKLPLGVDKDFFFSGILNNGIRDDPYRTLDMLEDHGSVVVYIVDTYEHMAFSNRVEILRHTFDGGDTFIPLRWHYFDSTDKKLPIKLDNGFLVCNGDCMYYNVPHIFQCEAPGRLVVPRESVVDDRFFPPLDCDFVEVSTDGRALAPRWDRTGPDPEFTITELRVTKPTLVDLLTLVRVYSPPDVIIDLAEFEGVKGITSAVIFNQDANLGILLASTYPHSLIWTGAPLEELQKALLIRQARFLSMPASKDMLRKVINAFTEMAKINESNKKAPLHVATGKIKNKNQKDDA